MLGPDANAAGPDWKPTTNYIKQARCKLRVKWALTYIEHVLVLVQEACCAVVDVTSIVGDQELILLAGVNRKVVVASQLVPAQNKAQVYTSGWIAAKDHKQVQALVDMSTSMQGN